MEAQVLVPTNLNLRAWHEIVVTPDELQVVAYSTFGFPAVYDGPSPSPFTDNHTSAKAHPHKVAHYITIDIGHRVMLGPFDHPPFAPWCQINPLLTRAKKDSTSWRVILDLS